MTLEPSFGQALVIRRARVDDAPSIVSIWEAIVTERIYSAIDRAFSVANERAYLQGLSRREAVFLAEIGTQVAGFQTLDLWVHYTHSMDHVGQLGTFVIREYRGKDIGRALSEYAFSFARSVGYEKLMIFVRASNFGAQHFYKRIGFTPCGQLTRQVKIDGKYDDEILMELFL